MYKKNKITHINSGDNMNTDIRKYIIGNFKEDDVEDIKNSIEISINSHEDDILIGLGVFFELMWMNSDEDTRKIILDNIKKQIQKETDK